MRRNIFISAVMCGTVNKGSGKIMVKAGLIGEKLGYSLSPRIHREFYEYTGIQGSYELFEMKRDDLANGIEALQRRGYAGVNVTIPYKRDVMPLMKEISQNARRIGAVNTIRFSKKGYCGYNTDYFGLEMLFAQNDIGIPEKTAVILGWGGAARCAERLLLDKGAKAVTIISRMPEKVRAQSPAIGYPALLRMKDIDILVNTTPVGIYPDTDACPVSEKVVENTKNVVDIIYTPPETQLLKHAKRTGKKGVNGLLMLVGQAVKAQEIWNGRRFPDDITMRIYNDLSKEL